MVVLEACLPRGSTPRAASHAAGGRGQLQQRGAGLVAGGGEHEVALARSGSGCWPRRWRRGCSPRGSLPSEARTPTRPRPSELHVLLHAAAVRDHDRRVGRRRPCPCGPRSAAAGAPDLLARALVERDQAALARPPGVTITRSPSTSGDSLHFHIDIIWPPKSAGRLLPPALLAGGRLDGRRGRPRCRGRRAGRRPRSACRADRRIWSSHGAPTFADPQLLAVGGVERDQRAARRPRRPSCRCGRRRRRRSRSRSPSPVAFQASGGPTAGQACSRPVSVETPSRLGPRHCGQPARRAARPRRRREASGATTTTRRGRRRVMATSVMRHAARGGHCATAPGAGGR